jgi:hypothetical protein
MLTTPPNPATASTSSPSSRSRPVNEATSRGSVRVAAATPPSTGRPRATASNSARTRPIRCSASASNSGFYIRVIICLVNREDRYPELHLPTVILGLTCEDQITSVGRAIDSARSCVSMSRSTGTCRLPSRHPLAEPRLPHLGRHISDSRLCAATRRIKCSKIVGAVGFEPTKPLACKARLYRRGELPAVA